MNLFIRLNQNQTNLREGDVFQFIILKNRYKRLQMSYKKIVL